ncbi:Aspartate aminotransferase, cytoplasmic [Fusarium oxysporum f. sp. cepae]|uniref:Aspartate aminotransferase, cytoplasmic n=1 Tax=Fusarium oxysporum f. sp. cepae TaxID=396571 RepID=A0A3L6P0W2_FUSOX|nr:Aspartate aminotransferase, cytoplasmic [Fusarium oxysporum f. sp. cepae]RKK58083.1 Aspartate aminotransferase, cytoplasmic [Fusarium oxysporum f. sp. cepae]
MTVITRPAQANGSFFGSAECYPPDAIFALTEAYRKDPSPNKVNLGQGAYRDEHGLPQVLPCVEDALDALDEKGLDHEYLPILGLTGFRERVAELVIGKDVFKSKKDLVACCQTLSGTGSLHLLGKLIAHCHSSKPKILIPQPTWSNHTHIYASLGFECISFQYYDPDTKSLDFDAYMTALNEAEPGTAIILHACAHNPTGCDPSQEQWCQIGRTVKERRLFPVFDAAYLGFNSGSYDRDAFPIMHFVNDLELEAAICISFAKNMGLYGCLVLHTSTPEAATNSTSVLERIQRGEISNPPAYGAKIVETVLSNPELTETWYQDMANMSNRISSMRHALYNNLLDHATPGLWKHLFRQSGMFGFLGLSPNVVKELRETYHIYMADNARISLAGLNESNVAYVAASIAACVRREVQH